MKYIFVQNSPQSSAWAARKKLKMVICMKTLKFVQPAWRCSGLGSNIQKAHNGIFHSCSRRHFPCPGYVTCLFVVTMPLQNTNKIIISGVERNSVGQWSTDSRCNGSRPLCAMRKTYYLKLLIDLWIWSIIRDTFRHQAPLQAPEVVLFSYPMQRRSWVSFHQCIYRSRIRLWELNTGDFVQSRYWAPCSVDNTIIPYNPNASDFSITPR